MTVVGFEDGGWSIVEDLDLCFDCGVFVVIDAAALIIAVGVNGLGRGDWATKGGE